MNLNYNIHTIVLPPPPREGEEIKSKVKDMGQSVEYQMEKGFDITLKCGGIFILIKPPKFLQNMAVPV